VYHSYKLVKLTKLWLLALFELSS